MRIFLVSSDNLPISLVSHDYLNGLHCCRSKNESFRRVFEVVSIQPLQKFIKNGNNVSVAFSYITDYDWIDLIIDKLSNNKWDFKELDLKKGISNFEELVNIYLS